MPTWSSALRQWTAPLAGGPSVSRALILIYVDDAAATRALRARVPESQGIMDPLSLEWPSQAVAVHFHRLLRREHVVQRRGGPPGAVWRIPFGAVDRGICTPMVEPPVQYTDEPQADSGSGGEDDPPQLAPPAAAGAGGGPAPAGRQRLPRAAQTGEGLTESPPTPGAYARPRRRRRGSDSSASSNQSYGDDAEVECVSFEPPTGTPSFPSL